MPHYRQLVLINAVEGRDDELNRWYDEVHLPQVLALPGFVSAKRYAVSQAGGDEPSHKYATLYEMDAEDPNAPLADVYARMKSGEIGSTDTIKHDGVILLLHELPAPEA